VPLRGVNGELSKNQLCSIASHKGEIDNTHSRLFILWQCNKASKKLNEGLNKKMAWTAFNPSTPSVNASPSMEGLFHSDNNSAHEIAFFPIFLSCLGMLVMAICTNLSNGKICRHTNGLAPIFSSYHFFRPTCEFS